MSVRDKHSSLFDKIVKLTQKVFLHCAKILSWCTDTGNNDIQPKATQQNDAQHGSKQCSAVCCNKHLMMHVIMLIVFVLSVRMLLCYYEKCHCGVCHCTE